MNAIDKGMNCKVYDYKEATKRRRNAVAQVDKDMYNGHKDDKDTEVGVSGILKSRRADFLNISVPYASRHSRI